MRAYMPSAPDGPSAPDTTVGPMCRASQPTAAPAALGAAIETVGPGAPPP